MAAPLHGRITTILILSIVIARGCENSRAAPSSVTNELKDAYLDIGMLERAAAFTERHKREFDTAVEQDQMPKFWSDFLTEYKALACSDTSTLTWDARLEIARSAANACMIPL